MIDEILAHAKAEYPRESCGLVIVKKGKEKYVPCENKGWGEHEFSISPSDYAAASDEGEIIKVVHSHPNSNPTPSKRDLRNMETSPFNWIIINPITGEYSEHKSNRNTSLVGKPYIFGEQDCYSLIRDYYKTKLNINLTDYDRSDARWGAMEGVFSVYEAEGFTKVGDLKKHDVVLVDIGVRIPFHFGVYLGDGTVLHHARDRLSSRDTYNGASLWYKKTVGYFRHIDLVDY